MVEKTLLQRITINNILAFMIVGAYVGMWSFAVFSGLTDIVPDGETRLGVIMDAVESMSGILSTMTAIVVMVVVFYFRKQQEPPAPAVP